MKKKKAQSLPRHPGYRQILDHYEPRLIPDQENYQILDWGSRESQYQRFQVIADILAEFQASRPNQSTTGTSLLDVGCGFAELSAFLRQRSLPTRYFGIDLCEKFVVAAKKNNPDYHLVVGDVFRQSPFLPAAFEVVYCSGTLNLKGPAHVRLIRTALAAMLELCQSMLVVNFLHARTADKYEHCYYCLPDEAIAQLPTPLKGTVEIIDNYLENDFTMIVRK